MAGERELVTGLLSKEANFRLVVSGPVGVKGDRAADSKARTRQRDFGRSGRRRGRQLGRPVSLQSSHQRRTRQPFVSERDGSRMSVRALERQQVQLWITGITLDTDQSRTLATLRAGYRWYVIERFRIGHRVT